MTRERAGCLVRTLRIAHDTACVPMRGGPSSLGTRLPPEDLFARGGRRAPFVHRGSGATELKQNGEHARRIYHAVYTARCALHYTQPDIVNRSGKWSKRLAEPCQRNRITSTGRARLSESPRSQWRRDFQRHCWEFHRCEIDRPIFFHESLN